MWRARTRAEMKALAHIKRAECFQTWSREYEKTSVAMTGVFSEVPPERVELVMVLL